MMSEPSIGGNVAMIHEAAKVMVNTGTAATDSGKRAADISRQMEGQVNEATAMLTKHFTEAADTLRQAIKSTKDQLGVVAWTGRAKEAADAAEADLNGNVERVLQRANEGVEGFKSSMLQRALAFVSMIETEFGGVTTQIDLSYQDLAKASQTFAENLQRADESIKFGG